MLHERGNISIHAENIFPIIKKWLYSEKDIFIRELVSNSADAISKIKKLVSIGETTVEENTRYRITVEIDKEKKTIKVIDNGIGMTADEVRKYINQIAFSGALDFIEKYKDKTDESQIIGHFGLGFYSAFMVADKVQIDTLSYQQDAAAVRWISAGGMDYEMEESDRTERGTTVTLYLSEDSLEYLEQYKMREILLKYFSFLPVDLYLEAVETEAEKNDSKKTAKDEEKNKDAKKEPTPLNDTQPLWLKRVADCTEQEYKDFYTKVFHDFNEPLFWIHLNMDYPFNLKGILYFPKLKHEFETYEGQIKLYYNQVFVADNIKEVIPDFLMLLKGTIDCPDLPLNVSRSFLQNDGYVKKISSHITKKVADKLISLYENERENYNKYWDDINPFVKYGCMREERFYDRVKDIIIFKTTNGDYVTLKDYLDRNSEKHKDKVFYVTDEKQQSQYIRLFKEQGMEAVLLQSLIDNHFIQFMEMKDNNIKFNRIDAEISDNLKSSNDEDNKEWEQAFEKMFKDALGGENLKLKVENLKSANIPSMILLSEQSRRMHEMSKMFGGDMNTANLFPTEETLVVNRGNSLIQSLYEMRDKEDRQEDVKMICQHIYDLAMMSHRQLDAEAMAAFFERSNRILQRITEK